MEQACLGPGSCIYLVGTGSSCVYSVRLVIVKCVTGTDNRTWACDNYVSMY